MKLRLDEIVNVYDGGQDLIEMEIPVDFAFKLATILQELQPKREIFVKAARKIKRDEKGNFDHKAFEKLCSYEYEVPVEKLRKSEVMEAFEKVPTKVLLALLPVIDGEL